MMKRILAFALLALVLAGAAGASAEARIMVRAGGSFGYAVMQDGSVWSWGDGERGQLGSGKLKTIFLNVEGAVGLDGNHIVDIQCGNVAALFLMDDGTVYSCGYNDYGQQGFPGAGEIVSKPTLIPALERITQVACGFGQCLALDEDGHVWAWGRNSNGQVGNGKTKNVRQPIMLALEDIVSVQCGGEFCLALQADGTVWGWGDNEYYQLTDVSRKQDVPTPTKLNLPMTFVQIGCGGDCSFGIDENGVLWGWGRNDYHQLGTEEGGSLTKTPVRAALPEGARVARIIAYNSHVAALTDEGALWMWGSGSHGQLGNGAAHGSDLPYNAFPGQVVLDADVGSLHSSALLADGTIWSCGSNAYGQLGVMKKVDYVVVDWKKSNLNLIECTRGN